VTPSMWFDGWANVGRVIAVGAAAYVVMVIELRVAGKRTLAKMSAFDLVVTVALGSVLATIALSRDVSLVEGAVAITLLVTAQWVVSWLSVRTGWVARIVRAEATIVFRDGDFDAEALDRARVLRAEVDQAIRAGGFGDREQVGAVVLETDGSLSVIPLEHCTSGTALPSPTGRTPQTRPSSVAIDKQGEDEWNFTQT
jgi:uncharacterized membrane protein YcaP (DUF421 family)